MYNAVEKSINKSFSQTLINTTLDLSPDLLEIPLDTITENDVLKEIPIIKTILSVYRIGVAYKERAFIKKILAFLIQFQNGTIDTARLSDFQCRFESDDRYRDKVMDFVLIMLDRVLSTSKAEILAKLFKAYVEGNYEWETYVDLCSCVDSLLLIDLKLLIYLIEHNEKVVIEQISIDEDYSLLASVNRLSSFGFITYSPMTWGALQSEFKKEIFLNSWGRKFADTIK